MAYPYIDNPTELIRQINAFAFGPDCPAEIVERLQTIPGSQADVIVGALELLWTAYDLLTPDGVTLVGQCASYATAMGWATVNAEGRCEGMVAAVHRDQGDPGEYPPREEDPAPIVPLVPEPAPAPPSPPLPAMADPEAVAAMSTATGPGTKPKRGRPSKR